METIEIKDINGVVLFTHTAENNSIEITVEEAVKKNVNLFEANLTNAKLNEDHAGYRRQTASNDYQALPKQ